MDDFKLNDRVIVFGKNTKGKIAFIGETQFAEGIMYGVILDEPKGKYSGTVGDVCYFKCRKNYATFVRACQLEKDSNYSLEDLCARSVYPNYLKDSSSKHGLRNRELASKLERNNQTAKVTPLDSPNLNLSRSKQLLNEKYQMGDTIKDEVPKVEQNTQFDSHTLVSNFKNLNEALKELNIVQQRLNFRNKQMKAVGCYLRMLKTYMKWNEEYERTNNVRDHQKHNFLETLKDSVMKKLEQIVSQKVNETPQDSSVISDENSFLLLCVGVLEKRNEVLTNSLTYVREILQRAWNRSCSMKKCDCQDIRGLSDGKIKVQRRCKKCSSKELFTDIIEQETRRFLKSNPISKNNASEDSNKLLYKLKSQGKIRRYLETLIPDGEIINQVKGELQSSKIKRKYLKTGQLASGNTHNNLLNCFTEANVSAKRINFPTNTDGQKKSKMQSNLPPQSQKEKYQDKFGENATDPIKELKEFISEMVAKVSDSNKSKKNYTITDSTTVPIKEPEHEQRIVDQTSTMVNCLSQTTSEKAVEFKRKTKWTKGNLTVGARKETASNKCV